MTRVLAVKYGATMFATLRSILLLTVGVLIGGCATTHPLVEWREMRAEFNCDQYTLLDHPRYAHLFPGRETAPPECLVPPPPRKTLVGYKRVAFYDAETGRTTSAIVPAGAVIVK